LQGARFQMEGLTKHLNATHLCAACGAPEVEGLGCLCRCEVCGAPPGEGDPTCPACVTFGRVEFVPRELPRLEESLY
jgi:hypothetical protein